VERIAREALAEVRARRERLPRQRPGGGGAARAQHAPRPPACGWRPTSPSASCRPRRRRALPGACARR
jgi:hypothetical protein